MNIKTSFLLLSALTGGICVAGNTWTGGAGNSNLDDVNNWGGAAPADGSDAIIDTAVAQPLKLESPRWTIDRLQVKKDNVFDLGVGRMFYLKSRFNLVGGSMLTLKSGTFGIDPSSSSPNRMFLGDSGYGNKVVVDGADSYFCGAAGTGNDRFISIGQNTGLNTFTVRNGGHLTGEIHMGQYCTEGSALPMGTNELTISGYSSYDVAENRATIVGYMQPRNKVRITDHSTMTSAGPIQIGCLNVKNSTIYRSSYENEVLVDDYSSLKATDVDVGRFGDDNLFRLASGSTATINNLHIGRQRVNTDPLFPSPLTGNAVSVEDEGTALTVKKVVIGYTNACNGAFQVKKGAKVTFPADDEMFVGYGVDNNGIAGTNEFFVGFGSEVKMSGQFGVTIGRFAGANHNKMVVEGNLEMLANNAGKIWYVGREGSENLFAIRDGGAVTVTNMTFYLSDVAGAVGNRIEMSDGASLDMRVSGPNPAEFNNNTPRFHIGYQGSSNGLTVDGSTVDAPNHYLCIGSGANATGNTTTISGDSTVTFNRVIVGDQGKNNTLVVSNGLVNVETTLDGSYSSANATGNKIIFAGGNSKIVSKLKFRPRNTTTIEVRTPADGKMASPLIKCSGVETTNESTPTFKVTGSLKEAVTLVESASDISDAEFNRMTFDLPGNVRLVREQKKLILKPVYGIMLIVR